MDSWDLENFKYLNLTSEPLGGFKAAGSMQSRNTEEFKNIQSTEDQFESDLTYCSYLSVKDGVLPKLAPLENCCLLDVVTVRNESVYAFSTSTESESGSINGTKTDGSTKSSLELDEGYGKSIPSDYGEAGKGSARKCKDYCNDLGKIPPTTKGKKHHASPDKKHNRLHFYFGEEIELNSTEGIRKPKLKAPAIPPPKNKIRQPPANPQPATAEEQSVRIPSPYYVRLRKNLTYLKSPNVRHPRNFGLDKNGQLFIDYSSNWINLEKNMPGNSSLITC